MDAVRLAERRVLERIATGDPLPGVLSDIVRMVEERAERMLCSILLFDDVEQTLRHGAAPSLPVAYCRALEGLQIGPAEGSCGTAAHKRERVVVEDITTHPSWEAYRELALSHGLRACWSAPILSSTQDLLGTFAMYYPEVRGPTADEIAWVDTATHLAAIAIARDRTEQSRRQSETRARQLARLYAVSSSVNEAISRVRDAHELYQVACRIAVREGLARLAWVGLYRAHEDRIEAVARCGVDDGYIDNLLMRVRAAAVRTGPAVKAMRTGAASIANDIAVDPDFQWKDEALRRGLRSCAVFPLRPGGQTVGVLAIYGDRPGRFCDEEVHVLSALADDIAFGVESSANEIERRRLVVALRDRVKELTVLHRVARVLQGERSVDRAVLHEVVDLLPSGWRYTDLCEARLRWAGIEVATAGFCETPWQLATHFGAGADTGTIAVVYREAPAGDDPFIDEERELLRSLADMLGAHLCRVAVEARLRRNEELLRMAGRAARLGGFSVELPERNLVWSDEVCGIHEVPVGTSPSLREAMEFFVAAHRGALCDAVDACATKGAPFDLELQLVTAGLRRAWVRVMGRAERDADGGIVRIQGAIQDVDERRALEAQLLQAQKMEAVGQLAGGVAHDFNNLLTVILGYTALAMESLEPSDPSRADLQEVTKAGERASELTRQLLAFSRKQVLEPRIVDVNQIVAGVDKMLRRIVGDDVHISLTTSPLAEYVLADPGQLEHVIMNLVVNARDAMPMGGTLAIETLRADLDAAYAAAHPGVVPGKYVVISVSDTGVGMDEATRSRIFEPFFTTKEAGKGTGLGLSTVWGIVTQSDGHVWVHSEPGAGTRFEVCLPRAEHPVEHGPPEEKDLATVRGSETVLVVEDEDQVRALVRGILTRHGYTVLEAQNGGEAFLICEQIDARIHLLLTDLVMPRMTGHELAERLTTMRPGLRVLYLSGYTEDSLARASELARGTAVLAKPLTPDALLRKVREVLDAEPARAPRSKPNGHARQCR
jgi:signal transduction histidine kinase/putative methionine-R-sulfoxide reductase with GAF domain/ActR/RegA family two-component response regulator